MFRRLHISSVSSCLAYTFRATLAHEHPRRADLISLPATPYLSGARLASTTPDSADFTVLTDDKIAHEMRDLPGPKDSFIAGLLQYAYETCDGPQAYALLSGLSVLSMAAPQSAHVRFGAKISPSVWGLCIGPTGDRKTAKCNKAVEILEAIDDAIVGPDYVSEQALLKGFMEQPRQFLYHKEFDRFLTATKSGGAMEALLPTYQQLYDGGRLRTSGVKRGELSVRNPQAAVLACAAHGVMEHSTDEHTWTRGFLPRFTIFVSDRKRKLLPPPDRPEMRDALVEMLGERFARVSGPISPRDCMTGDAVAFLQDWDDRMERLYTSEKSHRWMAGVYNRLSVTALKASLTFSMDFGAASSSWGAPWKLDTHELSLGCKVAEMHALSIEGLFNSLASSQWERERRSVVSVLSETQGTSLKGLLRRVRPRLDQKRMQYIIDSVEAEGAARKEARPTGAAWFLVPEEAEVVEAAPVTALNRDGEAREDFSFDVWDREDREDPGLRDIGQ